jgi:hypothetical protein
MRKGLGLLIALGLLLPVGMWVAGPAGGATPLPPKCKTFTGTETWKPPLPKLGDKTLVTGATTLAAKLGGCTGVAGITSGTSNAVTKFTKQNCTTTVANSQKGSKSTGTIKWNNGKTTTTANTLTLKSKVGVSPAIFQLVSKYTAGIGAGHTTTSTISVLLNKNACISATLSKATFHATKSTTT